MAITYKITIDSMRTLPNPQGFVTDVMFTVSGTDGTNNASIQDNLRFNPKENQLEIPYENLTQDIVLGWINAETQNLINHYANIEGQINSIVNPPIVPVATALPW